MTNASTAALLELLLARYKLKNDAALARTLNIAPTNLSRLRHGRLQLGASVILNIHETLGMPVEEIRKAAGVPRPSAVMAAV